MPSRRLVPPFLRQLEGDALGLGRAAQSRRSERLVARTATADEIVQSICPYCAVGCGQKVYVKDGKVIQIEGDPDSPIGIHFLGGATLDSEENYLIKKFFTAAGAVSIENQARI